MNNERPLRRSELGQQGQAEEASGTPGKSYARPASAQPDAEMPRRSAVVVPPGKADTSSTRWLLPLIAIGFAGLLGMVALFVLLGDGPESSDVEVLTAAQTSDEATEGSAEAVAVGADDTDTIGTSDNAEGDINAADANTVSDTSADGADGLETADAETPSAAEAGSPSTVAPTTTSPTTETQTGAATVTLSKYSPPARLVDADEFSSGYAVFSNGKITLRGRTNSEAAARIVGLSEDILGPENVIDEYVIDETVFTTTRPFFVEDLVLFDAGGTEIAPEFDALIGAGVLLLQTEPTANILVLGFADSVGDADANLKLSEARVQAIIDRAVELGANESQLEGRGLGETLPIADNQTQEGRQLNRRVEFMIEGIIS